MQISTQLKKNTLWSILDLGIYPVMMIIATPIFIKNLGYEQYGIWMLASTVNQFIFILNFGLGDSTIKIISGNRALGKNSLIVSSINTNWSQAIIICVLSSILGGIISLTSLVEFYFHVPNNLQHIAKTVLFLAFTSAGIKFCEMVLLSVFKGYERFDISSQLSLLSRNSVVLINIFLVILGYSLSTIFLSIVLVNILNVLIQIITLSKKFPTLRFTPKLSIRLQFINKDQFWYWLQSVIGLIGFLSDKLFVGYFTNLKTLGIYSIASLVGNQLYNILMSLGSFMFPKVAYERSLNNGFLQLFNNSRFAIAAVGWTLIYILLSNGYWIFSWWLGNDFYKESIEYINLYLVFVAFMILNIIPYQFINASDSLIYNSVLEIILRLSHVTGILIGYFYNNVNGLLWGLIITTAINMIFQYDVFYKYFLKVPSYLNSIFIVIPAFGFIIYILNASYIINISSLCFSLITFYFFYYKSSNLFFGDERNK